VCAGAGRAARTIGGAAAFADCDLHALADPNADAAADIHTDTRPHTDLAANIDAAAAD
jgi:hypothetical protein